MLALRLGQCVIKLSIASQKSVVNRINSVNNTDLINPFSEIRLH